MEKKEKKDNIPVLVICIIVFLGLIVLMASLSRLLPNKTVDDVLDLLIGIQQSDSIPVDIKGRLNGAIEPLKGLSEAGNTSFNGVVGQMQVLVSVIMVVTNRKKGFIAAVILNAFSLIQTLITLLRSGRMTSLPGTIIPVVTIIILFVIYSFITRNEKMNDELKKSVEQEKENNRIMKEKDEALQYLAYYDRLTQMPNRQLFLETLEDNVKTNKKCSIIYADLDDFRRINDSYGHGTGDEILKTYAHRLESICRDGDFAAKIGGDEFGIILDDNYEEEDVAAFVGNMQRIFAEPVNVRGEAFTVNASFGIAVFPKDARSAEDLFRCAETAMFVAKTNGKNQLYFYYRR